MVSSVLAPVQQRGREALQRLGLPTRRQEAWRLTDLKRLGAVHALPLIPADARDDLPEPPQRGLRLLLGADQNPLEGVTLPSGIKALNNDELKSLLGRATDHCGCSEDWPVELNKSSSQQILALQISGKVPPLELVIDASGSGLLATRLLLILDPKAELDLLQVFRSENGVAHSHLCEIQLGEESHLHHGLLSIGDGEGSLLTTLATQQEPRSNYAFSSFVQGSMFARIEPRIVQLRGQAFTSLKGLAVATDEQQIGVHSAMRFDGPEGELDQLQKSLVSGKSHTIFNGSIQVPKEAQQTNAAQLSRNLMLSSRARVDTKPELEIIADDVKCAHGATVSQLQEDELFYLRSRGITEMEATALLLNGYCQEVIDQLPAEAARWKLSERVHNLLISAV